MALTAPSIDQLRKSRHVLPALCGVALLVVLLSAFFFVSGLASSNQRLGQAVVSAAQAQLAPLVRQHSIPPELKQQATQLLQQPDMGVNYITLRNADQVILVSRGQYDHVAGGMSATNGRQVRGFLYRVLSSDHRAALHQDHAVAGYIDFGVKWTAVISHAAIGTWIALLIFIAALVALARYAMPAWSTLREPSDSSPDTAKKKQHKTRPWPGAMLKRPAAAGDRSGSLSLLSDMADQAEVGFLTAGSDGRIRLLNQAAADLLGGAPDRLKGQPAETVVKTFDERGRPLSSPLQKCLYGGRKSSRQRAHLRVANAGTVEVELTASALPDSGDDAVAVLIWQFASSADGAQPHADMAALAGALLERSDEATLVADDRGRIVHANASAETMLGRDRRTLGNLHVAELLPDAFSDGLPAPADWARVEVTGRAGPDMPLEMKSMAMQWGQRPAHAVILRQPLLAMASMPASDETAVGSSGVTARHALEERIGQIRTGDDPQCWLLMVVNWRRCRQVSRDFGWSVGDGALSAFAQALEQAPVDAEAVAHLGGGEFALLVRAEGGDEQGAQAQAERLRSAFAQPLHYDNLELATELDIGMALFRGQEEDAPDPLRCAALALDTAREVADGQAWLYTENMAPGSVGRSPAAIRLRKALATNIVELLYQPVATGSDPQLIGAARVRLQWQDGHGALLADSELLEHAQQLGLLADVVFWTLRRVANAHANWRDIGLSAVPIVVPLTAAALALPDTAVCWQRLAGHYAMQDGSLIAQMSARDWAGASLDVPPPGMRLALVCDLDAPPVDAADIVCLDLCATDADGAQTGDLMQSLTAYGYKHDRKLLVGPVDAAGDSQLLPDTDSVFSYGQRVGAACPRREFGHELARHEVHPL